MYTKLTAIAESKSKDEWQKLYDSHTLKEIGVLLGLGSDARVPVKKILEYHDIVVRRCGAGPNGPNRKGTGLSVPETETWEQSDTELAEKYGCTPYAIRITRCDRGVKRKRTYEKDFDIYNSKVRRLTEKTYQKHKDVLNPDDLPRGRMGTEGAHQIDHLKSVRRCYEEGVSPEDASALSNLELVSWEENLARRNY